MSIRTSVKVFIILILIIADQGTTSTLFFSLQEVKAQQNEPIFLTTPYFGSKTIKSFFDHEYPTYAGSPNNNNAIFTRYDGRRWTGVPKDSCVETPENNCYDGHDGIDVGLSYEHAIAAADGIVTRADWANSTCFDCSFGLVVEIEHDINGERFRTRYGHLSTITIAVNQVVSSGWVIGTSGSTGSSSGPHLHFDVYKYINGGWRAIDPFGWQPGPNADVQIDPWAQYSTGAVSWCMWKYGEWANLCDSSQPSLPLPRPKTDMEFVVNDTINNSNGFSKGFGGRWHNQCTGTNTSGCRDWWEANGVGDLGHTYYTSADGNTTEDNWAEWQTINNLPPYSQLFEVFVYIPHIPNQGFDTYTWQAKYKVVDGATPSRTYTTIVDEGTTNSSLHNPTNKWLSIGIYYLTNYSYVYTTDATGEGQNTHCRNGPNGWCRMTTDAVKFVRLGTTYLPDVPKTYFSSNIIVQNLSGSNANLKLSFFTSNGNYCAGAWPTISAHGIIRYTSSLCSGYDIHTVQVDSNQDISVVVENRAPNVASNYVGILPRGQSTNPDWNEIATELYLPTFKIKHYGRSSYLRLLNTAASSTTVTAKFYLDNGDQKWSTSFVLGPRAEMGYQMTDTSKGTLFSGRITSTQPLAVVILESDDAATQVAEAQAIAGSALLTYAPLIKKNRYNQNTGLRIFNPSTSSANITVTYYESVSPYRIFTHQVGLIPSNGAVTLYADPVLPDNFVGSAKISSSNVGVTAELHEAGPVRKMMSNVYQFTGSVSQSRTSYVARICQNCSDGFTTGLRVQNVGNATTTVQIRYYDANGNQIGVVETLSTLNMGRAQNASYIPNGLNGSAIITADQPIVVTANLANSDTNKDLAMTYNAPNR